MAAEDQGRRRIAQLIHDDSLQTLLAANQDLIEAAPGRAQVQRAHEVVEAAIARLREAMLALHPVTLEQGGFEQALGAVARQAARQGGFEIELDVAPRRSAARTSCCSPSPASCSPTPPATRGRDRGLGRARATRGDGARARGRRRRPRDRRQGAAAEALAEGHIGLASVNERVRAAGGEFELDSSAAGTRARAPAAGQRRGLASG